MVFPSDPAPIFVNPSNPTLLLSTQPDRFQKILSVALERSLAVPDGELLAFELFSGSQFEVSERARFLALLMAVESTLPDTPRDSNSLMLIEYLLSIIQTCKQVDDSNRASLAGAVSRLRYQSARAGAKNLLTARLGTSRVLNLTRL